MQRASRSQSLFTCPAQQTPIEPMNMDIHTMFIVTKEIDSENISKLCRTCLREDGEKMVCLFVGPAGSSLAAKLRTLSCLEVWQGDGLPEKLCDRCVTRAESALLYREQCRAADRALRQAASKVSREALDATVSTSKLYHQQKQGFPALQNAHKSPKCTECGAVFTTYQELCTHSQGHLPFVQENRPVQHMNIVESQSIPGYMGSDARLEKAPRVMSNAFVTPGIIESVSPTKNDRAACALHCSLCNHTFTNRIQLINHHDLTHSHEDVESSSCDDNLVMNEKIHALGNSDFQPGISQSVHPGIPNPTDYARSNVEAINYSAHMNLDSRNMVSDPQMQRQNINSEDSEISSDACSDQILRFPSFADVEMQHESANLQQRQAPPHCLAAGEVYKDDNLGAEASSSVQKKLHRCSICEKSFSQRSKLVAHNLQHTGEKPFECLHCEKAYTSKSKLNAHTKLHTQIDVHRCSVCDKSFPYPSYLAEHAKVHEIERTNPLGREGAKEFECSICKKQFRLLKNLKVHLRLHTGKGLVRCEICHKTFGQKYNLKVHLRTHNAANKFFKCNYCGKSFSARGNFVEHLRIHTKVKPFKCRMCSKSFSQSSHLKTHEASHNSLRPHQCGLCGKRYKLAAHLRRHGSIHTATKAYKCDLCEQMFSHEFSLKRHLKRHNEAQS